MNEEKINTVLAAAEAVDAALDAPGLGDRVTAAMARLRTAVKAARLAQKLPTPRRILWVEVTGGVADVSLPAPLPPGWGHEIIDYDNLEEEIQTEAQFHDLPVFFAHRILQTNPYFLERIQQREGQAAEEAERTKQQRRQRFVELAKDLTPDDYRELAAELAPAVQAITGAAGGESTAPGAPRGSR